MELKKYQKQVITDLTDYLKQLQEQQSLPDAFTTYWESRQVPVGEHGVAPYQNTIDGVPDVCYKVPTGGGKTFLACASIKPIFDALSGKQHKAVVWLVPTDSILTQTLAALKNPRHPYHQRLKADFSSHLEVYSKEELLAGQNFNPTSVAENLSVMVLSYDSFRSSKKEGRKAYQANGNLTPFATVFGAAELPIKNADETSLFQVINQLNPVVIVDESHRTTSALSQDMLTDFNPAFILNLTATPAKQANIISYVDALALKNENMVKLPVIAYNRSSQAEVITDAIDLRNSLQVAATKQYEEGGRYIRPIVLFQAQPKKGENTTSFEKLRKKLVKIGIPEEEIAIKTSEINELRNVDLLSPECKIKFIITVNALKEGWDCPFAYILASLANKTSQVDVEQILGRVLRQPHAKKQKNSLLNMSYVLTSSNDFSSTLNNIILGLNNAGFSKRDFRCANQEDVDFEATIPGTTQLEKTQVNGSSTESVDEEFLNFDEKEVAGELNSRETTSQLQQAPTSVGLATMLEQAQKQGASYEQEAGLASKMGDIFLPADLEARVETSAVNPEFADEISKLELPQFVVQTPPSSLFSTGNDGFDTLKKEALAEGFSLLNKDTSLDLSSADEQMFRIDVLSNSEVPKAFRMSSIDQRIMREYFSKLDLKAQKRNAADAIYQRLKPINSINDSDLRKYIERVIDTFGGEEMLVYQQHPYAVAEKLKQKILGLLEEHKVAKFYRDIETRKIDVQPKYKLPSVIQPLHSSSLIGGSLYESEDRMNSDEMDLASRLSALDNIKWWHRNIERRGFCINGPLNHYPDFIAMTHNGVVLALEPKGEQLKNDDSRRKLRLGRKWADLAGSKYRYYMVFQDDVSPLEDAVNLSALIDIIKQL